MISLFILILVSFLPLNYASSPSCVVARESRNSTLLTKLFTCLWNNHVVTTEAFRRSELANWQGRPRSLARQPLLRNAMDIKGLTPDPIYTHFLPLLRLFEPRPGINEIWSQSKRAATNRFLKALEASPIVFDVYTSLKHNGHLRSRNINSLSSFIRYLKRAWFTPYGRKMKSHKRAIYDTTGFEHVFVGEYNNDNATVLGFHSWPQYLLQESMGKIRYFGSYRQNSMLNLASIKFSWNGLVKKYSTMLFGSRPDFDMMVFTSCFLINRQSECQLTIDHNVVNVITHGVGWQSESVGSAYFNFN